MTVGLCANAFKGFFISDAMARNYILLLMAALLFHTIFFICSYNKKTIVLSLLLFVAATAAALLYIQSNTALRGIFADSESNPYMFYYIVFFFAAIIFLLSRTRAGTAILFFIGIFTTALVAFLYQNCSLWAFVLFIWLCGTMLLHKNYQYNVLNSNTVKPSLVSIFIISLLVSGLAVSISAVSYQTIIKPLHPPTRELKLVTMMMSLELLEEIGVSSKTILIDPKQTTQKTDETKITSQKEGEELRDAPETDNIEKNSEQNNNTAGTENQFNGLNPNNQKNLFYAVRYTMRNVSFLYLTMAIAFLIFLIIFAKIALRKRWYKKTLQKPRKQQIIDFYRYYLKKLSVIGIKKTNEETPFEFAERMQQHLRSFAAGTIDIHMMTSIFTKVYYGNLDIKDEEYQAYLLFYKDFHKNCKNYIGNFKYMLKYFVL